MDWSSDYGLLVFSSLADNQWVNVISHAWGDRCPEKCQVPRLLLASWYGHAGGVTWGVLTIDNIWDPNFPSSGRRWRSGRRGDQPVLLSLGSHMTFIMCGRGTLVSQHREIGSLQVNRIANRAGTHSRYHLTINY